MIDFGGRRANGESNGERESEATRARRRVCLAQLVHSFGRDNEDIVSDAGRKAETVCAAKEFFKIIIPKQDERTEQDFFDWEKMAHHISQCTASPPALCLPKELWLIKTRPRRGDVSGLPNLFVKKDKLKTLKRKKKLVRGKEKLQMCQLTCL